MKKTLIFLFLLLTSNLFSQEEVGCSIAGLLVNSKKTVFEKDDCVGSADIEKKSLNNKKTKLRISKELLSIDVLHENELVVIERISSKGVKSCPPFCIEAMSIPNVLTVGELETLNFIKKLKEKKARLLIDVRESKFYQEGTIPGAINLPFSMLKDKSKYQEEVLKLLGARARKEKVKKEWSFKKAQSLLIFGDSATTSEASATIKKLLELGYPSSKLLYYRAGIVSWKALGLTTY